ncbi:MAG: ROK family protein [Patescibacteria group bacterium]|nr:ROK family protein [Patescibacteria group bacterium]MDD5295080.1 ROK family protein [Patescibacteria group bacterium]MDD5554245.1 ROK family protein [Patescibacteria group bacterium]
MENNKHNSHDYAIGVDIGGTNMKAVLFDGEKIIADYLLATPKDNIKHFSIMLSALIEPLFKKARADKAKVKGLGLGIAGLMDRSEKKIIKSPNIPILDGVKIANLLKNKTDLAVELDNDTNCFLRAEIKLGMGKKYKNAYGIIIGTGIGGAWWQGGEIYRGSHGASDEPGRMIIDLENNIELEKAYQKLTQSNPANLAEEAFRGDTLAQKSYEEIGHCLGIAFANIVNLLDPEVIIVGGSVAESSELFFSKIKKIMRGYIMHPEAKKIKILKGKLGQNAGAIGAALLIL